jgi:tetratricopeptide (TPR) repeat protein
MNAEPNPAKAIFLEAVERHAPDEWPAFLDRACTGQPELRGRVDVLLAAHREVATAGHGDEAEGVRPVPTLGEPPIREGPGAVIGPYTLVEQIGEGGFGVVFVAEQVQPIRRRVALKVLKPGMDTRQIVARFEAERQALALMDHPNIAQIHDGGTTPDGRPYFVMELVKGVPITDYCDGCSLTTRERLELMLSVCQAVQHAHQKGVIHRDLKPSNVLVAVLDGKPEVKVIDFGVAKAVNQRLSEHTVATGFHQMVGTPLYMSPEQAELSPIDVDTRADVFALGVLLYEMLTGTTPLEKERLSKAGYDELRRLIREEEPPTPSARLSTLQDRLTAVAVQRRTDPRQLLRTVRGELDWIAMKCLDKDRNRRYETANSLAQDLRHYLANEPVEACPPSARYRVRKFGRRNRVALAFAGLTLLFLVLFGAGLGWAAGDRAARQRVREAEADDALNLAARCLEEGKWPEAAAWAQRAEGVLAGGENHPGGRRRLQAIRADLDMVAQLQEIRIRQSRVRDEKFDVSGTEPEFAQAFRGYGIDVDALEVDQAAAAIRERPIRRELVLGLDDWAFTRPKRESGTNSRHHLLAVSRAADDDDFRNQLRRALGRQPIDRPALERLAASDEAGTLPVPSIVLLVRALREVEAVDAALKLLGQVVRRYPSDFWVNHGLGYCLTQVRPPRYQEAIRFYMAARALRPQSPGVCLNLGVALAESGDPEGAIAAYEEAIKLKPDYAAPYYDRGNAYHKLGQEERALDDYTRAIELKPDLASAWYNRGNANYRLRRLEKAVADYTKAIELQMNDADIWYYRGNAYLDLGQGEKAVADYSQAIERKPDYVSAWYNRGNAHRLLGQNEKALADYTEAVKLKPDHAHAWDNRGLVYDALDQREEAIADHTKATELEPGNANAWYNRGNSHAVLGHRGEAIADLTKAIALQPDFAKAWCNRGNVYFDQDQRDQAFADWNKALELQPDLAQAWHSRGLAYQRMHELEKAIADYTKALEFKADYVEALTNRGLAYFLRGEPAKAVADYSKALAVKPDHVNAWNNRGAAYSKLGEREMAVADCTRAIELQPDFVNAWINRGEAYRGLGQWDKAAADYSKAIDLKPAFPGLLNNLAWVLATCPEPKVRDPRRAVKLATKAIELEPKNASYWNTLGQAHYRAGSPKEAVAALEKSVELRKGGDCSDWLFLAMARWQLGEKDEAERWYGQAVRSMDKDRPQDENVRRLAAEAAELLKKSN